MLASVFAKCKDEGMDDLTPTSLSKTLGISISYASLILSGQREMPRDMAIRLYRATGMKCGPVTGATDAEIETLANFPDRAPMAQTKRQKA